MEGVVTATYPSNCTLAVRGFDDLLRPVEFIAQCGFLSNPFDAVVLRPAANLRWFT